MDANENNAEEGNEQDLPEDMSEDRGETEDTVDETDEEEQQFDITLAASHSYIGSGLVNVSGRQVLEPGWRGRVPVLAHHGAVFPGETVPMLLREHDAVQVAAAIRADKLFGLLCPDETGTIVIGYGVLCEVYEARMDGNEGAGEAEPHEVTFKARAGYRFRFANMPKQPLSLREYTRMRVEEVEVLPEVWCGSPLRDTRLHSLDQHRTDQFNLDKIETTLRRMDAALTPWPGFLYDMFDFRRMKTAIKDYFRTLSLEKLPDDAVSLSFWVASNLTLSPRDRLSLFVVDSALLRLHMELQFIDAKSVLCCSSCMMEISRREHMFAMSSEGLHSNYTNIGGYLHDIVTVSKASNIEMNGSPSSEYSWFPGYTWTIALCAACMQHVGWRFDALKRSLRPQRFYGLCRNLVQPRSAEDPDSTPLTRSQRGLMRYFRGAFDGEF